MTARKQVVAHRQQLLQLTGLANADLRAVLSALDRDDVGRVRSLLIELLPELVSPYMAASGELSAVWFENLRAEAGKRGIFYAEAAPIELPHERVDRLARWAVSPLADEALGSTVESRLSGAVQRLIFDVSRDTLAENGIRDRVAYYQRMPASGCCAFCGMLASRPVYMGYKSEASAGGVVGRGSMRTGLDAAGKSLSGGRGGGITARGKRALGSATHDDCRCIPIPVFPGSDMASLAKTTRLDFEEKYQQSLTNEEGKSLTSTKDILAEWRKLHGTK